MINKTVYFNYGGLEGKGIVVDKSNLCIVRLIGNLEGKGHRAYYGEYAGRNYWFVPECECVITDNKLFK